MNAGVFVWIGTQFNMSVEAWRTVGTAEPETEIWIEPPTMLAVNTGRAGGAAAFTVTDAEAESSAGLASLLVEPANAELVALPTEFGRTVILKVAPAFTFSVPRVSTRFPAFVVMVPCYALTEINVAPGGLTLVTLTPLAAAGP